MSQLPVSIPSQLTLFSRLLRTAEGRCLAEARSLCQQEGLTVVCNLHQVELARQYSDRILGIRAGELVLDVPADKLS